MNILKEVCLRYRMDAECTVCEMLSWLLNEDFAVPASSYPEDRLRYWNGYLLFYERMEEPHTPTTAKRSRVLSRRMLPQGG